MPVLSTRRRQHSNTTFSGKCSAHKNKQLSPPLYVSPPSAARRRTPSSWFYFGSPSRPHRYDTIARIRAGFRRVDFTTPRVFSIISQQNSRMISVRCQTGNGSRVPEQVSPASVSYMPRRAYGSTTPRRHIIALRHRRRAGRRCRETVSIGTMMQANEAEQRPAVEHTPVRQCFSLVNRQY